MKILLLNTYDSGGGAAIASVRMTIALINKGIDAKLGVLEKRSNYSFVVKMKRLSKRSILSRGISKFKTLLEYREFISDNPVLHSENRRTMIDIDEINRSDYDLVHLNWINADMISIEDLGRIKKPLVWTLHDSWPFCGAEHHPNQFEQDTRYMDGYTKDTRPASTKGKDLCRLTWERKIEAWRCLRIRFIAPSRWERQMLQESALFKHVACEAIPNVIPAKIFRKGIMSDNRRIFGLPEDTKIIGFGAANGIENARSIKGGDLLLNALRKLPKDMQYMLLVFGPADREFKQAIDMPSFYCGPIENPAILAALYNCCDVFVVPSVIENLSTTALEAMFCGVPVAAFDTGGNSDIIEDGYTGHLAPRFDTDALSRGISECILNHDALSENSINRAHARFDEDLIVSKQIGVYKAMLEEIEVPE